MGLTNPSKKEFVKKLKMLSNIKLNLLEAESRV